MDKHIQDAIAHYINYFTDNTISIQGVSYFLMSLDEPINIDSNTLIKYLNKLVEQEFIKSVENNSYYVLREISNDFAAS